MAASLLGAGSTFSPVGILNGMARIRTGIQVRSAAYGNGKRHALDVYLPRMIPANGAPVVIFFYGGGWEEGERSTYYFVGSALAECGFVAVVPDYRVYPEARFPDFMADAARAVRWVRDRIAGFGGDPGRMVLMGHSAGAHIAALLAFDKSRLRALDIDPGLTVKGLVGLAGPYDFLPLKSQRLRDILGPEPTLPRTQPINFVDGDAAPCLLATGRSDDTVDPGNTLRLAERIRQAGGRAETRSYPWVGHRTIIGALAAPLRFLAPVLADTAEFVGRATSGAQSAYRTAVAMEDTPCPS